MASEDDWVMRPVLEGLCAYESLKTGSIDLEDIARMNDALDVYEENQSRIHKSLEKS